MRRMVFELVKVNLKCILHACIKHTYVPYLVPIPRHQPSIVPIPDHQVLSLFQTTSLALPPFQTIKYYSYSRPPSIAPIPGHQPSIVPIPEHQPSIVPIPVLIPDHQPSTAPIPGHQPSIVPIPDHQPSIISIPNHQPSIAPIRLALPPFLSLFQTTSLALSPFQGINLIILVSILKPHVLHPRVVCVQQVWV